MKRLIKLLPIAAVICMGMLSCDKDDNDEEDAGKNSNIYIGHEYVDLGLSVKWATCNVGATTPEECGDYYVWGDTITLYEPGYAQEDPLDHWKEGKTAGYKWETYKYCNGTYKTLTKYCNKSNYGNIDSDTTLLPVDDIAHSKWGGNWRMPTQAEFKALLDSCNCEFIIQNGVKGLKVTSRKDSSQSIFLPAAGYRSVTSLSYGGSRGYYWSSSLYTGGPYNAWYLYFGQDFGSTDVYSRSYGRSVRPVCP